jgi:hypothetical protein
LADGRSGLDVDQLRKAVGRGVAGGGAPPTPDPAFAAAVVDTATQFTKGFAKGASDTALGIVNSPGGQIAAGPLGFEGNVLRAAITGDANQLAPVKLDIPDAKALNDPNRQATAVAQLEGAVKSVVDPIGFAKDAVVTSATVLVTGDPEQVGEAAGKTAVVAGTALALGGVGELGAAGAAGDAEAAGAAGGALDGGAAGAAGGAVDAGAGAVAGDAPLSSGFGEFDGPFGNPGPPSLPITEPAPVVLGDSPAPLSGFDPALPPPPAEISPAADSVAPPGPPPPLDPPPISRLPGIDEPTPPPPPLPPGGPPGFPFGVDPPSAPGLLDD